VRVNRLPLAIFTFVHHPVRHYAPRRFPSQRNPYHRQCNFARNVRVCSGRGPFRAVAHLAGWLIASWPMATIVRARYSQTSPWRLRPVACANAQARSSWIVSMPSASRFEFRRSALIVAPCTTYTLGLVYKKIADGARCMQDAKKGRSTDDASTTRPGHGPDCRYIARSVRRVRWIQRHDPSRPVLKQALWPSCALSAT